MNGRATVADVAKRAKVSRSTVSHALSGKRPISLKVRERIFAAASALNYTPSAVGKAIRGQKMMIVAALVDGMEKASTGVLMETFQRAFAKHGYDMAIYVCGNDSAKALSLMRHLSGGLVDGIVNLLPDISVNQAVCACSPVPVLTYLRPHSSSPVYIDVKGGVRDAFDYLWGLGHRKIGFIGGDKAKGAEMISNPEVESVRFYLRERDAWDPCRVKQSPGEFNDGIVHADELFKQGCTAIVAANDQVAAGIYSWAFGEGVRIPDDLSVVGLNDSPLALMLTPALTSVQFPLRETAEITAEAMVERLNGDSFLQHRVLSPKLIIRRSAEAVKKTEAK